MKSNRLVKLVLGLVVGGLLVATCLIGLVGGWLLVRAASDALAPSSGPLLNRIAFVGNDGNLWLARPDGSEVRRITTGRGGVQLPTWAPDGRRLAFIGLDNENNPALFVYEAGRGQADLLFAQADAPPFYIYWSPDSHSVTFLTQESSDLAMRLADPSQPGADRVLAAGSPLYWVWSPVGDQLLLHVGGSRAASEEAHISFLDNRTDAQRVELQLAPGRFQAPTWSPDGQYVYYIAADVEGQEGIYRTDVHTSQQSLITLLDGPALMTLAPDGQHFAYLEFHRTGQVPSVGSAYVADASGVNRREVLSDWAVALYWSPDGRKLAVLTPAGDDQGPTARGPGRAAPLHQSERYRWWIYNVEADSLELLTSFYPSPGFLQTVPFFDQYDLSLTFWSPDSRYVVVSRWEPNGLGGTIWVVDTTGRSLPRQIGEGGLAVWSWR
jgi:TolB protein